MTYIMVWKEALVSLFEGSIPELGWTENSCKILIRDKFCLQDYQIF
jgi:hypothetical protein